MQLRESSGSVVLSIGELIWIEDYFAIWKEDK